jgi:putative membrane protein
MTAWDGLAVAVLVVAAAAYARGAAVMTGRRQHGMGSGLAFWAGWAVLVGSVMPPLDTLALELFSAHMAQHELMMLVGVPLVIAARPLPVWLHALSLPRRHALRRQWRRTGLSRVLAIAAQPPIAWLLHGLVVWVWHAPSLYEAAMRHDSLHLVQHASFIGTSMLFWWGLLNGHYGRAGYGAAVVYVFTTAVHTGALGAALAFAPSLVYGAYAGPAAARGVDALNDQQLAGLLMWIPAGLLFTLFGLGLLLAWIGASTRTHDVRANASGTSAATHP